MLTQHYRIYTDENTSFEADLDLSRPIRLLVNELVRERKLLSSSREGKRYAVFGADHRRLSNEQSLSQTAAASGGILYLADAYTPWWVPRVTPNAPIGTSGQSRPISGVWIPGLIGGVLVGWTIIFSHWYSGPPALQETVTATIEPAPPFSTLMPTATLVPIALDPVEASPDLQPTDTAISPVTTIQAIPTAPAENAPEIPVKPPTLTWPPWTPTPLLRTFHPEVVRDFPGGPPSNQGASCIIGSVRGRNGGVANALLYANNGQSNSILVATNAEGKYSICNLGASVWSIVLTFVPRSNNPSRNALNERNNPVATVHLSGGSDQVASVNFVER